MIALYEIAQWTLCEATRPSKLAFPFKHIVEVEELITSGRLK